MHHFLQRIFQCQEVILAQKEGYRTRTLTGKELEEKVHSIRFFFQQKHLQKGDKVIFFAKNSLEWIAAYFACILSGIVAVPLDVFSNKEFVQKVRKQTQAKMILDDEVLKKFAAISFSASEKKISLQQKIPPARVHSSNLLQLLYTSGTTGEPKGVMLSYENMSSAIETAQKYVPKLPLRFLHALPLSHIFGQTYALFVALLNGQKLFFSDTLLPREIISFIKRKNIHGAYFVPGQLQALRRALERRWLKKELGWQFFLIGVGGASLDPEQESWWKRHLILVVQGYGLTETTGVVSINPLLGKVGSAGRIIPKIEVRLAEDKEILVKGKNVTSGYFQNPQKTTESFVGNWFKTGDVGELKKNYLFIKERKKDMIVLPNGLNIYPSDIEKALNRLPEVRESCVLEKNKKIHAVFLLHKKISPEKLIQEANKRLSSSQRITSYSLWKGREFPKTPTGKIKKFVVLQELEKPKKYAYATELLQLIAEVLEPQQKITLKSTLGDLGMDSLKRVELVAALENAYSVELPEEAVHTKMCVQQLESLLKESHPVVKAFTSWQLSVPAKTIRWLGQWLIAYPFLSLFTRPKYAGMENIPQGLVVFAANHQSAWDGALAIKKAKRKIAIPAAATTVFGMGTKNPWKKFTGVMAKLFFNAYPFGETIGTWASLTFTGEFLDRGYSILIFPEGARTLDGKIHHFQRGVGYLATQMNVPIVPVKIEGLYEVLPRGRIIPKFGRSTITFGKPLYLEHLSYVQATKKIEEMVKKL